MAGQPAPPRPRGRLVLAAMLLVATILIAWLLLRARPAADPAQAPEEQPIGVYLARADLARGEAYFSRCSACHTVAEGGPHGVGPNLWGVMGRPIATRPGYSASAELRARTGTWDWETTNLFLRSPRDFAPRTRMTFAGISDPQNRADVMLYLNSQGGTLPPPAGAR